MEQAGAIIVVFGLLLLGRGLLGMLRSDRIAAGNSRRRASSGIGWFQRPKSMSEMRNPPPVRGTAVRRQGRRVLAFGGALVALGSILLALA